MNDLGQLCQENVIDITLCPACNNLQTEGKTIPTTSMQPQNECSPNPCKNGGSCLIGLSNDYSCLCLDGYKGKMMFQQIQSKIKIFF